MKTDISNIIDRYKKAKTSSEKGFVDKHVDNVEVTDAPGAESVDKAAKSTSKHDRKKTRQGYEPGEDASVYENFSIINLIDEAIAETIDELDEEERAIVEEMFSTSDGYLEMIESLFEEDDDADDDLKESQLNEVDLKKVSTAKLKQIIKDGEDEKVSITFANLIKSARKELARRGEKLNESLIDLLDEEFPDESQLDESTGAIVGTKVGKIIQDRSKETTKFGGHVNLSIQRGKAVVAHIMKGGKIEHSFNAEITPGGKWKLGRSSMSGAAKDIIGTQKTFSDDIAAKALEAVFNAA